MKLQTEDREVLKGGVGIESQFKIKATGKAFQILSSGLYSNKILAIIRELSCNASDAHVAAGKKDVPIEIHLPTALKPTFHVKDFGIGLDHDGIMNLYTTYFESTKQDSNDFIGALGLGSKSPFSYVNNFMVESRFNGMKRTYTAFINEQGLPSITLMNTESTDESNGLTVSLAVKRDDIYKFRDEAKKALMYFNPAPTVKGCPEFSTYSLKHTLTGSNWKVRDAEYASHMEGPYVIQGFVSYPVDVDQIKQHKISEVAVELLGINLDITVPIGQVEVAASRESLSYVPQTIQNLINNLEVAAKEIRKTIESEINKCSTLWEATKKFNEYQNSSIVGYSFMSLFDAMHKKKHFTWNGKELFSSVNTSFHYKHVKHTVGLRAMIYSGRYGMRFRVESKVKPNPNIQQQYNEDDVTFSVRPTKSTFVYIDDVIKNGNLTIQQHVLSMQNIHHRDVEIIIFRPTSKDEFDQTEIDSIIKNLGNPETTLVSTLPKPVADGTKFIKKRDTSERLVWSGFPEERGRYGRDKARRVFSKLCWNTMEIDLKAGGFFVPVKRFSILDGTREVNYFDTLISAAKEMSMIKDDITIYGFNEKEMEAIKGKKKWVNLIDFLKDEFTKLNQNNELVDLVAIKKVVGDIGNSFESNFILKNDTLQNKLEKCSFSEVLNDMATLYQDAKKKDIKAEYVRGFLTGIADSDTTAKISKREEELSERWEKMLSEYDMLSLVSWTYMDQNKLSMVIDYINLVAKAK